MKKGQQKKRQQNKVISRYQNAQNRDNTAYSAPCCSIGEQQVGTIGHQTSYCRRHFFPTFYMFGSSVIIALEMSICDNFCSASKDILIAITTQLSSLAFARQNGSCLIGPRQRLRASGRRPRRRCRNLFACHRFDHPPYPHPRSSGWTLPHCCIAVTVATQYFSRIPFARRQRFRLCPDSGCVVSAIC